MTDQPRGKQGVPDTGGTVARWNGYGLSQWRCKCGAARKRPTRCWVRGDGLMVRVEAAPCKRCGSTEEPHAIWDPWQDFEESANA